MQYTDLRSSRIPQISRIPNLEADLRVVETLTLPYPSQAPTFLNNIGNSSYSNSTQNVIANPTPTLQKALEAEQRVAEAARREGSAAAEALSAEKAAKFAADAEARELQKLLEAAEESLGRERSFAATLGAEATRAREEVAAVSEEASGLARQASMLEEVRGAGF